MKIYNIGSLNIDYVYSVDSFVRPGETISSIDYNIFPGGKGLNQSVALGKAGANVIHGGIYGDGGDFLVEILNNANVDISRIKKVDGPSGHAIIEVDKTGQNRIILHGGANQKFTEDYIVELLEDAQEGDIVLLQNEINALDYIFEIAYKKGLQIALNPSPFNNKIKSLPLNYVKWWLCNEIEGSELTGENEPQKIAEKMLMLYPDSNLLLTLGKDGALYKSKTQEAYQPIIDVEVADTTAAGDTFTGYFLASVIKGATIEKCLLTAATASAIAVSRNGASVSIPTIDEVEGLIR